MSKLMSAVGWSLCTLLGVVAFAAAADDGTPNPHMDLFGNYELPSGKVLTGGPFEGGGILFMEAEGMTLGGLFSPAGPDAFESVFPPGMQLNGVRDEGGQVVALDWQIGPDKPMRVQRVFPHRREDISYESAGATISGSLFLPAGPGPHPCIVFIHGSGDQDRYAGPWATYFLQFGVATFVYDKRGAGDSTGDWRDGSFQILADDAVAAVDLLARRDDIDPERIGLHGSSEGGWVAPIAATASPRVSFLMVRVGPGQPAPETVLYEMEWDLREKELTPDELEATVGLTRDILDAARRGQAWDSLDALIDPVRETTWYRKAYGTDRPRGAGQRYWAWQVANANMDPADYVGRLDIPTLWFLAELDENVDTEASEPLLRAAFESAPTTDYDLRVLPEANHAFFVTRDGVPSYTTGYWAAMSTWLQARGFTAE
jgi:uncharacterized protein